MNNNTITWDALIENYISKQKLNFNTLSTIQRIILATNGTLTDVLEAYYLESVQVVKLSEVSLCILGDNLLALNSNNKVILRKILLQTQESKINCLYAESIIIMERLRKQFNNALVDTNRPIGKIWNEQKTETFKETLYLFEEPAGTLAEYFAVSSETMLICRTYRVFSQKQPIMLITEKFPNSFYL